MPTLDADVACGGCGYNLRGLDPAGRCPECGRPVAATLAEAAAVGRPFEPDLRLATAASRAVWAQGLACVLAAAAAVAGVAAVLAVAAPSRRGWGRTWLLSLTVAGWAVNGVGLWQLGGTDPAVDRRGRRAVGPAVLRAAAVVYTLLLVSALATLVQGDRLGVLFGLAFAAAGVVAAAATYVRLWRLSTSGGAGVVAGLCLVLGVLSPVAVLAAVTPVVTDDVGSLEALFRLPSPATGSVAWAAAAAVRLIGGQDGGEAFLIMALPAAAVATLAAVLRHVRRVAAAGVP